MDKNEKIELMKMIIWFNLFIGIYNLYVLHHPWWFNLEAILYFPAAIYGFKLIAKRG